MNKENPFHTIVVGDNGTPTADRAVKIAVSLAQVFKIKLVLLGVIAPPSPESQAEGVGLESTPDVKEQLEQKLDRTAEEGRQLGVDVVTEITEGDPGHEIERAAEQYSADLIVVGHRDISRARRWLEGSTSESLIRSSHISVLVVHDEHGDG